MRTSMKDAIETAFNDIKANIPEGAPAETPVPLLVNFTLGDLEYFLMARNRIRESAHLTTGG